MADMESQGVVVLELKQCRRCGEVKRLDDFHRRYDCNGTQSECKKCKNSAQNAARKQQRRSMRTPDNRGYWERSDEVAKGLECQLMLIAWAKVEGVERDG